MIFLSEFETDKLQHLEFVIEKNVKKTCEAFVLALVNSIMQLFLLQFNWNDDTQYFLEETKKSNQNCPIVMHLHYLHCDPMMMTLSHEFIFKQKNVNKEEDVERTKYVNHKFKFHTYIIRKKILIWFDLANKKKQKKLIHLFIYLSIPNIMNSVHFNQFIYLDFLCAFESNKQNSLWFELYICKWNMYVLLANLY